MDESQKENFNHLKIHSQYSICEGAIKIDELKDYTKENKIKALALCDSENLCGALEFAEKLSKVGTQPIIGSQINFKIKRINAPPIHIIKRSSTVTANISPNNSPMISNLINDKKPITTSPTANDE